MSTNLITNNDGDLLDQRFVLDFPTRMNDGRQFTDFRSSCYVNLPEQSMSTYQYRLYLKHNAEKIMNNSVGINENISTCSQCSDYDIVKPDLALTCDGNNCLSQINKDAAGGEYYVDNNKSTV